MKSNVRLPFLVLLLILLISAFPIISVLVSEAIANTTGCNLNEANVHACMAWGIDIGHAPAVMYLAGWFGLARRPLGALSLVES